MLTRATLNNRPSSRKLLARVLETPQLPAQIQALPAPVLGKLIEQIGLEDAAELVALATSEQLAQIFDEDLWRAEQIGEDERFDAERFLVWLEIMLEAGERFVAERLAELPQELLTLALHRHVLVLSLDDLRAELTAGDDEAEAAEKAFESCLTEEIDDYQLIWRGGDGFDQVIAALLALDRDHHSLVADLLERCAYLSHEYIADQGGLYEVLTAEQTLEADLAASREQRRAEKGYVAPTAAAAFLRLALRSGPSDTPFTEHDPLTRAYFRELSATPAPGPLRRQTAAPAPARDLLALLETSGISLAPRPQHLLGTANDRAAQPLLIAALEQLASLDPAKLAERNEELAYLSNVLLAGGSVAGRRLRPIEAVEHAVACVSLGLSLVCGTTDATEAARQLLKWPCDGLLRLAFARAREPGRQPVPQFAAKALLRVRALLKALKV